MTDLFFMLYVVNYLTNKTTSRLFSYNKNILNSIKFNKLQLKSLSEILEPEEYKYFPI